MNGREWLVLVILIAVVGGLVFSLGYAIHLNAKRQDEYRSECLKRGGEYKYSECKACKVTP